MSGDRRKKRGRSYSPRVEILEALRLLSGSTSAALPAHLVAEHGLLDGPIAPPPSVPETPTNDAAWDAALDHAELADLFGPALPMGVVSDAAPTSSLSDSQAIASGLSQLDRYLGRAWGRAGIAQQQHDDCTQAVYTQLLQLLGRDQFDSLAEEVGQYGIREVLSRDTADGPDFFRTIDTVKKRTQREKTFQPLDAQLDPVSTDSATDGDADRRGDLHEAIARRLSPREAALIYETLQGSTPSEIASRWGVAPKTVSNEKTRVFQKLREALVSDWAD